MPEIEIPVATDVSVAAEMLAAKALERQQTYTATFNDIIMVAEPGDSPEAVEAAWQRQVDARAEAYCGSSE